MSDALSTVYRLLEKRATSFEFYQAMRMIEGASPTTPRWGNAAHPRDEPVRLRQSAELNFAPSAIASFERTPVAAMTVRFMGLHGSHGPLPLHLTEYIRQQQRRKGSEDQGAARFLDIFHHRMLSLFYRGWAQSQPVVSQDRPEEDRFGEYIGSLFGIGEKSLQRRDTIPDTAKRHFAGLLASPTRPVSGLRQILCAYFQVSVQVEQNVGQWSTLPRSERSRLGRAGDGVGYARQSGHIGQVGQAGRSGSAYSGAANSGAANSGLDRTDMGHSVLGRSALCGRRVWDRQYGLRIVFGPLSLPEYLACLPGGRRFVATRDWLALYLRDPLDVTLRLRVCRDAVPVSRLGARGDANAAAVAAAGRVGAALGRTCWLGNGGRRLESIRCRDSIIDFPLRYSARAT